MLSSAHLLEQAERLLDPLPDEVRARPTDRCRAISSAYYAVFHAGLTAAADQAVGTDVRGTVLYSLAYRSIDHAKMKGLCRLVVQKGPSIKRFMPESGWGDAIAGYANSFVTLNELRMQADYDPTYVVLPSEVANYILVARSAIGLLDAAEPEPRRAFLTLLLFPPR